MFTYRQNSRVLEIGVGEHDGDARFLTGSRNKAVLRMRNEKYAIWPLVMAESPKLLHRSAMDLWIRLWGRYHVPQNVLLVYLYYFLIPVLNSQGRKNCAMHGKNTKTSCNGLYFSSSSSFTSPITRPITVAFLGRFLQFFKLWKQEWTFHNSV